MNAPQPIQPILCAGESVTNPTASPLARRLTGQRNRCPTCQEFFNSNAAFDKHRTGKYGQNPPARRCLTVVEMLARGMARNRAGFWVTEPSDYQHGEPA